MPDVDMTTKLGPLTLKNPVLVSSGTFGTGEEYTDFFDINKLGGIVTKAVTREERTGNPPPRIVETPAGLLNAIGLENVGLERFIAEKLPFLQGLDTTVIVNVAGNTVDDYVTVAEALAGCRGIHALELNISCPNVKKGGLAFGVEPGQAAALVSAVRGRVQLPLIVKLTPNVTDIAAIAEAVAGAGADILSLVNTFRGMAININTRRPVLGNVTGGLSGPAIRPMAVCCVYQVARRVKLPLIGMGGISTAEHAVEFMLAGASAVSMGTANLVDPRAALHVIQGLETYFMENNIAKTPDIVGRVLNT